MAAPHIAVIAVAGLLLGSFSTALAYRVPRGIGWSCGERSACPSCKKVLGVRDLVPLFSWLAFRGKCRQCGVKISALYPLTELSVMASCLGAYIFNGFTPEAFFIIAAMPFLAALLVVDLEEMILPNPLVLAVALIGGLRLLYHAFMAGWPVGFDHILLPHLLGALLYAGLAWGLGWLVTKILRRNSLGFGDVKFFAAAGLWLGIANLGVFCILSGLFGVALALIWRAVTGKQHFPFGPALIASLYLLLLL